MKKRLSVMFLLLSFVFLCLVQCKNETWNDYYSTPEWMEPPIYEVLQNDGRFTSYLRCLDSTMYARILKSASLYTVFAPTDSAFKEYLKEQNYQSIDEVTNQEAEKIVAYSLVYNKYPFERLTDVLVNGWDTLVSLKKMTAYYESIYQEELSDGTRVWVVDANDGMNFVTGKNNNKYVPTYLSKLFNRRGFSSRDYEYFYPGKTYTGKNIQGASVVSEDIYASNGIIHAVDAVNLPLENLERLLKKNPNYSKVMDFFHRREAVSNEYRYMFYEPSSDVTDYFREIYPELNLREVYVKSYAIPLNAEKVGSDNESAEMEGYTFVAPTNAAVDSFYKEKIQPFTEAGKNAWTQIEEVPSEIMEYFMNAHISSSLVWPSNYRSSLNESGEFFNGKGSNGQSFEEANFVEVKVASNGFLYGTDHYVHSKYFETVYTQLLMDSTFSMMKGALNVYFENTLKEELMRCALNGYDSEYYILLMMQDVALENDGYVYEYQEEFGREVFSNGSASGADLTPEERLRRLVQSCVFVRIKNDQMNSTMDEIFKNGHSRTEGTPGYSKCYANYGFDVMLNYYGDMMRFKVATGAARLNRMEIQTLGAYDTRNTGNYYNVVGQVKDMDFINGVVYDMDARLPDYCVPATSYNEKSLGQYINDACDKNKAEYSEYKKYLNQVLFSYDSDTKNYINPVEIDNPAMVTVLMPNNAAMKKAVEDGYLPSYDQITDANSESYEEDCKKARNFLLFHILNGRVFINDLNPYNVIYAHQTATYQREVTQSSFYVIESVAATGSDNPMMVVVSKNDEGNLTFSTSAESSYIGGDSTKVEVILGAKNSNHFARKGVIHGIDGYLPCDPILY